MLRHLHQILFLHHFNIDDIFIVIFSVRAVFSSSEEWDNNLEMFFNLNALVLLVDSALRLYWSWNVGSRLLCAASGHQKPRRHLEPQEQPRTMAGISWQAVQGEKVQKMKIKKQKEKKSIIASARREIFGVAILEDFLLRHCYYHLMHHAHVKVINLIFFSLF